MRSVKSFSYVGRAEDEGHRGCAERALCEASAECIADTQGPSSIFCQLGSWVILFENQLPKITIPYARVLVSWLQLTRFLRRYATSYLLQRQSGVGFEALYEAGRRGRTGEDCRTLFMDCNAVWKRDVHLRPAFHRAWFRHCRISGFSSTERYN